jgi:hypothetical protein
VELLREPPPKDDPEVLAIRHVFYAHPSEAWRIDAHIMMLAAAAKAGWSQGFERLEGSSLGYEEWQTDLHLERLRADPHAKISPGCEKLESGPPKITDVNFRTDFVRRF